MKRKILASREMELEVAKTKNGKIEIYSFFPIDRADCDCKKMISDWKDALALLSEKRRGEKVVQQKCLVCPKDKTGMQRYKVTCNNCKETLGYCWATDSSLKDWCDFHYVIWTDGKEWFGGFTPQVSPITEELCIECTCGSDTRDFRANMTLPGKEAYELEKASKIGREFGKADSKFKVSIVTSDVVPFKEGIKNG